ncbi:DUF6471 domain-containing protein [Collimonas humicola]|uniref:DUF6471 domain-containing protein n=1 Tax=Collimonas humicola TaxID=2825886 RepID=UPI001E5D4B65|nr:DUF6471 domain-containing protein [Collimonas humicola]
MRTTLDRYIVIIYDNYNIWAIGITVQPNHWNDKAANILRSELTRSGLSYGDLVSKLKEIGVIETYAGIANKLSRGSFSFVFFLQCMQAIGRQDVNLDE